MKKRALAGLVATFAMLAGWGTASAQEVRLRLVSFVPPNTAFGIPTKRWVDEFNRRGKGILQVDMVGPEAVPPAEQANAVKTGVVDMQAGPPTFYHGAVMEGETLTLSDYSVPELRKSGAWEYLNKIYQQKLNVLLLTGFGDGVNFHVYTTRPANTADAAKPFAGFTLRTTPIYTAFLVSLGAKTIATAPGEVYTALERNMVQGYGWPLWGVKDLGWLALTRYRYDPGFYNVAVAILMNQDRWKKLDARQQALVQDMAVWMETEWPKWREETAANEEKIQKEAGVRVVDLGSDFRKRAHDIAWDALEAEDPRHIPTLRKLMRK